MEATGTLHDRGQSPWLDSITRELLESGTLGRYIGELAVTGLTSNPTIFDHAIKNSSRYDAAIRQEVKEGKSGEDLFFELALEDLTRLPHLGADARCGRARHRAGLDHGRGRIVEPMELGHLPYQDGAFEQYVGLRGLQAHGLAQWRRDVEDVVARVTAALEPEDVVLGGGNVHQLEALPPGCHAGDEQVRYARALVRSGEISSDAQPSTPSVLGKTGRNSSAARVRSARASSKNGSSADLADTAVVAMCPVVARAGRDRMSEDRRIRRAEAEQRVQPEDDRAVADEGSATGRDWL